MLRRISFKNSFRKSRGESTSSSKLAGDSILPSPIRTPRLPIISRRRKSSTPSPSPPPSEGDGDEYAEPFDIHKGPSSHGSSASPNISLGTPTNKHHLDADVGHRYSKPREIIRASQGSVSRPSSPRQTDRSSVSTKPLPDDDYQDPFDARARKDTMPAPLSSTAPSSVVSDELFMSSDTNADYCRPKDSLNHPSSNPNSRHPGLYSDFRPPMSDTASIRGRSETGSSVMSQKSDSRLNGSCVPPPHDVPESACSDLALESFAWFHGTISRDSAETMLQPSPDCSFLIRVSESRPTDYSLSLRNNGQLLHLKITRRPDGMFIMGQNSKPFRTVVDMISFYQRHRMLIKGAEHIRLLYIIPKGGAKPEDFNAYAQPRDHL